MIEYKVVNGEAIPMTEEDFAEIERGRAAEAEAIRNNPEARIEALKQQLTDTDYQAIKYAEGWITAEEYAPVKAQRQAWRDEINRLEAEISK